MPDARTDRTVGQALMDRGLLTPDQLAWAISAQGRTGSRMGSILVAAGLVKRRALYETLAENWDVPFVDVTAQALDPGLLALVDGQRLAREGWIPLRRNDDGTILVASSERPTPERRWLMETTLGGPVELAATTDWDIVQGVNRGYYPVVQDEAALGLWRRAEHQSARKVLTRQQQAIGGVLLGAVGVALVLAFRETIVVASAVASLTFLACVLFKFVVSMSGARHENDHGVSDQDVAALRDDELPTYTILVPLYKEANVVHDLIGNLAQLDYPSEKLEILLLLEPNDTDTIAAVRAAHPPETMTMLVVPEGGPKTKPKACNVGMFFARGDYLVIYDAEDRPEPDQLKKAFLSFQRGGEELVCVQAALNYWNDDENVLTRMFTLEYSYWFDYMLPGLDALGLPIPLGGTSNHFRTETLRRLGGWDPYNVTEDADLGIRATRARLPGRGRQLHHVRGSELRDGQLDPPALAVDQGVHADAARAHAAPGDTRARGRHPPGAGLRPAGGRHAVDLPPRPAAVRALHRLAGRAYGGAVELLPGLGPERQLVQPARRERADGVPVDDGRLQASPLSPRALGDAQPSLLDPPFDRGLQGRLATRDQASLLGEDRPWHQQPSRCRGRAPSGGSGHGCVSPPFGGRRGWPSPRRCSSCRS